MKATLEAALAEILPKVTGLRAVLVSAAPDGVIAWCWARDDKRDIALGFAALDRAATVCLEELGASRRRRSLLLTAEDTWVASWPLFDADEGEDAGIGQLVVTTVFEGELQSGMVMVYGTRVRHHLREALREAQDPALERLRAELIGHLLDANDVPASLARLADLLQVKPSALTRLEALSADQRGQLAALVGQPSKLSSTPPSL